MNRVYLFFVLLLSFVSIGKAQTLTKAFSLGDWLDQQAEVVYIANNGDVLVGGTSNGRPDFDPGPGVFQLDSTITTTGFLMRVDSLGNLLWVVQHDGPGLSWVREITEDASGNLYLAGTFVGTTDLDPGAGTYSVSAWGTTDVFLQKLDAAGNFLWGGHIHAVTSSFVKALEWDGTGGVIIAGSSSGMLDLDPADATTDLHAAIGSTDAYVARILADGTFDWGVSFGSATANSADLLAMDINKATGKLYITGSFTGTVDLDPSAGTDLYTAGGADFFLSSLDVMTGGYAWGMVLGGPGSERGWGIGVDAAGDLYILGGHTGTMDIDPGSGSVVLPSLGSDDLFLAKYTSTGMYLWGFPLATSGYDQGTSLTLDAAGNPHILGHTTGLIDFDPTAATLSLPGAGPIGYYKHFAASYDASGGLRWAGAASGPGGITTKSIAVRPDGTALLAGYFNGSVDLDPTVNIMPHTSAEDSATGISYDDLFLSWWKPDSCALLTVVTDSVKEFDCLGSAASISLHGALGEAPYTYVWSTGSSSSSITASSAGIYTVTLTDAKGCSKSTSYLLDAAMPGPADLQVDIFTTWLRAGFPAQVFGEGRNLSCAPVTGTMEVVLDSSLTYLSSSPAPASIAGDTLRYNFTGLTFDAPDLVPAITVRVPTWKHIGDWLCFDACLTPTAGDGHPADNIEMHHCVPIQAPHDPNIIQVWPSGECADNRVKLGEPLTYTVHFQNTGTIDAVNVVVLDTLDGNLSPLDVVVKTSSHDMYTEVLPGNVLKFIFPEIHLPDSSTDEPGSHGFVTYEVTPSPSITTGTEIHAKASIYFDFEEPIHTNEVWVTLVDSVLPCGSVGIADGQGLPSWVIFPNPAREEVMIHSEVKMEEVRVMNVLGEVVYMEHQSNGECLLSVDGWPVGVYLVSVRIGDRQETRRLLIQH